MALATGSLCDLGYVAEVTFGTTPGSPTMKRIRRTTTSLNLSKESYRSEEQRIDRATADLRHGVRNVDGNIDGELSVASWDDFLQAIMGGTWASAVSATESDFTSITSTTSTFTIGGGSWITKGFRVGDIITFTGLPDAGNNSKKFTITGLTATVATVAETVIANASPDTAFTVTNSKKLIIGNTYRSFTIERAYTDITQYQVFKGVRFNRLALDIPATGLVKCSFGVMGQDMSALSGTPLDASYDVVSSNSPLASVSGQLLEAGVALGTVTSMSLNIDNGIDGKAVVGSNIKPDLLWGKRQTVTGELTVLFTNATTYNKFVNETESELLVRLDDPNGTDYLKIYLPRIKYSGGTIGDDDPAGLPITMPFEGLIPLSTSTNKDASPLVFQRSNA